MIHITPITLDDLNGFHTLLGIVAREKLYITFTDAPPLEGTKAYLESCIKINAPFFVLKDNEKIIGWCDCIPKARETQKHEFVLGMGLHPEFRGKGHGRKLFQHTVNAAFQQGAIKVSLHVYEQNTRAKALYESEGFEVEGLLKQDILIDGIFFNSYTLA